MRMDIHTEKQQRQIEGWTDEQTNDQDRQKDGHLDWPNKYNQS